MKANTLEYTLTVILLIIITEKEVYLVTSYSCIFKVTKLNYDIYDKNFKVFYILYHYLKELELPINIIINYKNLEYFSTTKILFYYQAK